MSKKLTHDELIPQRGSGIAPENSFASAASGPFQTEAADQPTGEIIAPFAKREREYSAPPSNLPAVVTQRESLERNCSSGQSPWVAETSAEETILAGTVAATQATTPTAPAVVPVKQRDAIDPEGNTVEDAFSRLRRLGGGR